MKRVVVSISAALLVISIVAGPAFSMGGFPPPGACGPKPCYVTKMVPCVKTELVPELVPCTAVVPVKKVGMRCQKVMLRGTPVGCPQGADSCTQCYPQPFCQVVTQKVPFEYYEPKVIPWYNVRYRKVCKPVMLPQTYKVDAVPMCR